MKIEVEILKLSVDKLTAHINDFVATCVDEKGKPKAPSTQELMKIRGYLPQQSSMAFKKKEK